MKKMIIFNEKLLGIALPWGCDSDSSEVSKKEKKEKIEEIFNYLREYDLVSYGSEGSFLCFEHFNRTTKIIEICVRLKNGAILRLVTTQKLDGEEYRFIFDRLGSIKNDTNFQNSFDLKERSVTLNKERSLDILKEGMLNQDKYLSKTLKDSKDALEFDKNAFLENLKKEYDSGLIRYIYKGEQVFLAISSQEEKEIDGVITLCKCAL